MSAENLKLIHRVVKLLRNINFKPHGIDYQFEVTQGHGGVYVQGTYEEADIYTGELSIQYTRKWLLSPHMTDSEIVSTVFKLCITSMEHITREHFLYKEARVYSPHYDVEDLVELCKDRENAGGRQG